MSPKPEVGSKIPTWFSESPDGCSIVLAVEDYRGKYKHMFRWTVRVSAPRTQQRSLEMCVEY